MLKPEAYIGGLQLDAYIWGAYILGTYIQELISSDLYLEAYIWGLISEGLISGGLYLGANILGLISGGLITGPFIWGLYSGSFCPGGLRPTLTIFKGSTCFTCAEWAHAFAANKNESFVS